MSRKRRVDLRGILARPDLRRELMVPTIQATQAREGIETTREQAERAYYVVTEGERTAFFALEPFKAGRGQPDRRHEMFASALAKDTGRVRFDVARRDFAEIDGSPLAYSQIGLVAHLFRDYPPLSSIGETWQGIITRDDARYIRYWWEVAPNIARHPWVTIHKGGDFARFYYDADLVIDWSTEAQADFHRLRDVSIYFRRGLTWPRRTAKGLNVRRLPAGCVFSDKGPALLLKDSRFEDFLLGLCNSAAFEYIFTCKTSFSWEIGVMRAMPVPMARPERMEMIGEFADAIHQGKNSWDEGNETCTHFCAPWFLRGDLVGLEASIAVRLDRLAEHEAAEEVRIQKRYAELNDEVYTLYGIPESTRVVIEETLGERPPEILWPQMEGKTAEQKRMEHVFRLLSHAVKRVIEADEDGIVPFGPVAGEPSLAERVHRELQTLFPQLDIGQVEVELANELKKSVKGYRRAGGIAEWLDNAFFEFHCALYKNRPILWHIASSQGASPFAFGALVHYHRFDRNRMAQLRAQYLRDAIETFRREAALADKAGRTDARQDWQARLEETQELDRRLQSVQEGHHDGPDGGERDYRILTPWKTPEERPKGWNPDLDDGVKVNIEPLHKAGVLRVAKGV